MSQSCVNQWRDIVTERQSRLQVAESRLQVAVNQVAEQEQEIAYLRRQLNMYSTSSHLFPIAHSSFPLPSLQNSTHRPHSPSHPARSGQDVAFLIPSHPAMMYTPNHQPLHQQDIPTYTPPQPPRRLSDIEHSDVSFADSQTPDHSQGGKTKSHVSAQTTALLGITLTNSEYHTSPITKTTRPLDEQLPRTTSVSVDSNLPQCPGSASQGLKIADINQDPEDEIGKASQQRETELKLSLAGDLRRLREEKSARL